MKKYLKDTAKSTLEKFTNTQKIKTNLVLYGEEQQNNNKSEYIDIARNL